MGQNSSKKRSYTPSKSKNREVITLSNSQDVDANDGVSRYQHKEDGRNNDTEQAGTASVKAEASTQSSTNSGKKSKRKRFRVGFSLKRTPSGHWSRKKARVTSHNGTATVIEEAHDDEVADSLNDGRQETSDGGKVSESGKKSASNSQEKSKGKRGSGRNSSRSKQKIKEKKDKKKKKGSVEEQATGEQDEESSGIRAPTGADVDKISEKGLRITPDKDVELVETQNFHDGQGHNVEDYAAIIVADAVRNAQKHVREENQKTIESGTNVSEEPEKTLVSETNVTEELQNTPCSEANVESTNLTFPQDLIISGLAIECLQAEIAENDKPLQKIEKPLTFTESEKKEANMDDTRNSISENEDSSCEASSLQKVNSGLGHKSQSSVADLLPPEKLSEATGNDPTVALAGSCVTEVVSVVAGNAKNDDRQFGTLNVGNYDIVKSEVYEVIHSNDVKPETSDITNSDVLKVADDADFLNTDNRVYISDPAANMQTESNSSDIPTAGTCVYMKKSDSTNRTADDKIGDSAQSPDHSAQSYDQSNLDSLCKCPTQTDVVYEEMAMSLSAQDCSREPENQSEEEIVSRSEIGITPKIGEYDEVEIKVMEPYLLLDSNKYFEKESKIKEVDKCELQRQEKESGDKIKIDEEGEQPGQNRTDKPKKEKTKSQKKKLLPKKLSDWFHRTDKQEKSGTEIEHDLGKVESPLVVNEIDMHDESSHGQVNREVEAMEAVDCPLQHVISGAGSGDPDAANLAHYVTVTKSESSPNSNEPCLSTPSPASPTTPLNPPGAITSPPPDSDKKTGFGFLKKISIGSRLRTAITRKKSAEAVDQSQDEIVLSLTQSQFDANTSTEKRTESQMDENMTSAVKLAQSSTDETTTHTGKLHLKKSAVLYSPITEGAHNALFTPTETRESHPCVVSCTQVAPEFAQQLSDKTTSSNDDAATVNEHDQDATCGHNVDSNAQNSGTPPATTEISPAVTKSSVTYSVDVNPCEDEDDDTCPLLENDDINEETALNLTNINTNNIPPLDLPDLTPRVNTLADPTYSPPSHQTLDAAINPDASSLTKNVPNEETAMNLPTQDNTRESENRNEDEADSRSGDEITTRIRKYSEVEIKVMEPNLIFDTTENEISHKNKDLSKLSVAEGNSGNSTELATKLISPSDNKSTSPSSSSTKHQKLDSIDQTSGASTIFRDKHEHYISEQQSKHIEEKTRVDNLADKAGHRSESNYGEVKDKTPDYAYINDLSGEPELQRIKENGNIEDCINGRSVFKSTNDCDLNEGVTSNPAIKLLSNAEQETKENSTNIKEVTYYIIKNEQPACHNNEYGVNGRVRSEKFAEMPGCGNSAYISEHSIAHVDETSIINGHVDNLDDNNDGNTGVRNIDSNNTAEVSSKIRSSSNNDGIKVDNYISSSCKEESSNCQISTVTEDSKL